jgi:hypothetical protein
LNLKVAVLRALRAHRFRPAWRAVPMTWINDDDFLPRPDEINTGRVVYWLTSIVAFLIVVFVVADFFISWAQGTPIVRIVALLSAIVVWLIGSAFRALP